MDRIDDAILASLQKDGRISNKELAAAVGLAPSSCLERMRRLQERGVITGFRADVDPKAVGIGLQAFVFVRLAKVKNIRCEIVMEIKPSKIRKTEKNTAKTVDFV